MKPENLLLDSENHVKICDFGWIVNGSLPRTTMCGTIDFLAPELVRGDPYSFSVDIWAVGIILYELIHGHSPFPQSRDS